MVIFQQSGNIILGAAVVDDILAILILFPCFKSFKNGEGNLIVQFSMEILFFVFLFFVHKFILKFGNLNKLPIYAKNTTSALIIMLGFKFTCR